MADAFTQSPPPQSTSVLVLPSSGPSSACMLPARVPREPDPRYSLLLLLSFLTVLLPLLSRALLA